MCCAKWFVIVFMFYHFHGGLSFPLHENEMHPQKYFNNINYRNKRSIEFLEEETNSFWINKAQAKLREFLVKRVNTNTAKNVIFFLGDGMSIATLTASRMYSGQQQGKRGEDARLFFEDFPYIGLAKTYCVDKQVADSACTATAYLCGIKSSYGTIGVTARVKFNDCIESMKKENHVKPITKWALEAGKAVGIVTTTRITHATPAGTYAHIGSREWECDNDTISQKLDPKLCQDIASQLVFNSPGNEFNVIFGGGRGKFLPKTEKDEDGKPGQRMDDMNLIKTWLKLKNDSGVYIHDKKGLNSLDYDKNNYVLGLFDNDHLRYNLDMDRESKPTITELTVAAIKLLKKDKDGFFLFVEGGRIDHAHHETMAHKALDETVELAEAVKAAAGITNEDDTLIIVTSDHSHTMTLAGYSQRGDNILGLNSDKSDVDHLPYTTLSYANGPGYDNNLPTLRAKFTNEVVTDKNFRYPSAIPMQYESHGGEDVAVFANGPWSHLFTGVYEQNLIPHLIGYSACIGEGMKACKINFPS